MKAIDIGVPMLGMHSIRETCGVLDTVHYYELFKVFYKEYENINHDLLQHWSITKSASINDDFIFIIVQIQQLNEILKDSIVKCY